MPDADVSPSIAGTRRDILRRLKLDGPRSAAALAEAIGISVQGIGQHLAALQRDGLVAASSAPRDGREGRPGMLYRLSEAGESTFPRDYQALVLLLIDAVGAELGDAGLGRVLEALTRLRVERFAPLIAGLSLRERIDLLRGVYQEGDPYLTVDEVEGGWLITERNCPFLQVAMKRPQLCSTTVSVLAQVLGVRVVRERRFQDGHGCCAFRVYADQPAPAAFSPEPEPTTIP